MTQEATLLLGNMALLVGLPIGLFTLMAHEIAHKNRSWAEMLILGYSWCLIAGALATFLGNGLLQTFALNLAFAIAVVAALIRFFAYTDKRHDPAGDINFLVNQYNDKYEDIETFIANAKG